MLTEGAVVQKMEWIELLSETFVELKTEWMWLQLTEKTLLQKMALKQWLKQ